MKIRTTVLALIVLSPSVLAMTREEKALAQARLQMEKHGLLPSEVAVGDWNEDGRVDLAVAGNTGLHGVSIFLSDGGKEFLEPAKVSDAEGLRVARLVRGDFDGDGHLDLGLVHAGRLTILGGSGTGHFAYLAGSEEREIDPVRAAAYHPDDPEPRMPSVSLYDGTLVVDRGTGPVLYTGLAIGSQGLFAQNPDNVEATDDDAGDPDLYD